MGVPPVIIHLIQLSNDGIFPFPNTIHRAGGNPHDEHETAMISVLSSQQSTKEHVENRPVFPRRAYHIYVSLQEGK